MNHQRFFVFLIAFAVLFSTCGSSIVFFGFELNKKEIAKTLCVKKNIRGNHCNGKCHLKKQLEQESKREEGGPSGNIQKFEINYCEINNVMMNFSLTLISEFHTYYAANLYFSDPLPVFHPPLV